MPRAEVLNPNQILDILHSETNGNIYFGQKTLDGARFRGKEGLPSEIVKIIFEEQINGETAAICGLAPEAWNYSIIPAAKRLKIPVVPESFKPGNSQMRERIKSAFLSDHRREVSRGTIVLAGAKRAIATIGASGEEAIERFDDFLSQVKREAFW